MHYTVPSAPDNVHATGLNSTVIEVTWGPPVSPNGIVTHYLLDYEIYNIGDNSSGEEVSFRIDPEDGHMTYTVLLVNLMEFTSYRIQVSAFTSIGEGDVSETVLVTDPDMASPPTSFEVTAISSTALRLTWSYPMFPRGEISGYIIYNGTDEIINVTLATVDDTCSQSLTVSMLLAYTEYTFRVAAYAFHEGVMIIGATTIDVTEGTLEAGKN